MPESKYDHAKPQSFDFSSLRGNPVCKAGTSGVALVGLETGYPLPPVLLRSPPPVALSIAEDSTFQVFEKHSFKQMVVQ